MVKVSNLAENLIQTERQLAKYKCLHVCVCFYTLGSNSCCVLCVSFVAMVMVRATFHLALAENALQLCLKSPHFRENPYLLLT